MQINEQGFDSLFTGIGAFLKKAHKAGLHLDLVVNWHKMCPKAFFFFHKLGGFLHTGELF